MKLITPSFTGQGFGALDLNAVAPGTSPAFTFHREHLSGQEYGDYLALLADHFQLPIQEGTSVRNVYKDDGGFSVETNKGTMKAKDVIWEPVNSNSRNIRFMVQRLASTTARSPDGANLKKPIITW